MRQPPLESAFFRYVLYARYLIYRLKRAGRTDDANLIATLLARVKTLGRAWEDATEPVQDYKAERDIADGALDHMARAILHVLSGRSLNARKESPVMDIYPEGLRPYTHATLEDEAATYRLLHSRMGTYLPADDPLRASEMPALLDAITVWEKASTALSERRNEETLARQALDSSVAELRASVESVYGRLIADLGKKQAEPFFPTP